MKRAGFKHLGIGVESADDEILKVIKKNETLEEIENGIRLACELDFDVSLLFIVGSPKETMADVKKSMELAKKYPVMKAFFFNLIPFPGTELYEYVLTHKGRDFAPALIALTEWGDRWAAPDGPPILYRHAICGSAVSIGVQCATCGPVAKARCEPSLRWTS